MSALNLIDFCTEMTTIKCSSCGKTESDNAGVMEAIDDFYDAGWRFRKGACYCPSCSSDLGLLLPKKPRK